MSKFLQVGLEVFLDGFAQGKHGRDYQTKIQHFTINGSEYIVNGIHIPGVAGQAPTGFKATVGSFMGSFVVREYSET